MYFGDHRCFGKKDSRLPHYWKMYKKPVLTGTQRENQLDCANMQINVILSTDTIHHT